VTQKRHDTRPRPSGRERILSAAITCFARSLYTEVSLRDLAAVADVDVAYVHRSFGSKSELFRAALTELMEAEILFKQPCGRDEMIERMSATLTPDRSGRYPDVRVLDIILRSCTCEEPRQILREAVQEQFLDPLCNVFGEEERVEISFCLSLLLGVGIMRESLAIAPIASLPSDRMNELCDEILNRILRGSSPQTEPKALPVT